MSAKKQRIKNNLEYFAKIMSTLGKLTYNGGIREMGRKIEETVYEVVADEISKIK